MLIQKREPRLNVAKITLQFDRYSNYMNTLTPS